MICFYHHIFKYSKFKNYNQNYPNPYYPNFVKIKYVSDKPKLYFFKQDAKKN